MSVSADMIPAPSGPSELKILCCTLFLSVSISSVGPLITDSSESIIERSFVTKLPSNESKSPINGICSSKSDFRPDSSVPNNNRAPEMICVRLSWLRSVKPLR
ncbi:hypothetical protein Pla52n_68670 [Stieleria varia]|uniref:Uncharacterized protein n=1 Tax=Stieleria varia TaxID=2528005 RepID=A0A5C5ZSP1_9BACT|nr:hypothetical protein Pla52n_68670 [Stieleria varia]